MRRTFTLEVDLSETGTYRVEITGEQGDGVRAQYGGMPHAMIDAISFIVASFKHEVDEPLALRGGHP